MTELIVSAPTCRKCGQRPCRPNRGQRSGFSDWCAECRYVYDLWRWYRLTPEDYAAMLAEQMHTCAVCHEPFGDKRPHVDHKHGCSHSGKSRDYPGHAEACCRDCVRGLLCSTCNHFAGWLESRISLLGSALAYLGIEIAEP